MEDNHQANHKKPSHLLHYTTPHSARARACFWREAPLFIPLVPTAIGRVLVFFFDRSLSNIYYHFAFYGALHESNSNENEQMKILSCPQQCHAKYITPVLHCHACGGVLLFLMLCSRVIEYANGFLICQVCAKIACHCKPHVFFPTT